MAVTYSSEYQYEGEKVYEVKYRLENSGFVREVCSVKLDPVNVTGGAKQ